MCGIAGYIGQKDLRQDAIENTLSLMKRRGPDHSGYVRLAGAKGNNICLLHSRLEIIDLDKRSNQPFKIGNKNLIFNGELYNYVELRKELTDLGKTFTTQSDTEVLLTAIDHWGFDCLEKFEGMWGFAVYDELDGSLTLCRDRFGEKPLYSYQDETGLYFASEIKFLRSLIGKKLKINYQHMYRYLVNGYRALYKKETGFFRDVSEIGIASVMTVNADLEVSQSRYWKPEYSPDLSMSYADAVAGAREKLARSIELRLRADVPLAFCMSGGIDSNALISLAKKTFDYDVHGFTITNTDERYEEQELVNLSVKELGIRHTSIPVNTSSFLSNLKKLVRQHDAPVYTITYYAHWLLMQSIAEHGYRISVSGTGADELFTGYYDHHLSYLYEVHNNQEKHRTSLRNWEKNIKPLVRNPFLSDPDLFVKNRDFRDHLFLDAESFQTYLKNDWHEDFAETKYCDSLLRNRMLNELFHESVPVILHEDDLNAMYYSIENRSPFLDRGLFDFCNSIPSEHLVNNGYAKAVLRDSMKGIVPDDILLKYEKVGFNAPIFSFLNVNDPEIKKYLLDDSPIFEHVKREKIENIIGKSHLPNSESKFLFYFLNCKIFLEEFS